MAPSLLADPMIEGFLFYFKKALIQKLSNLDAISSEVEQRSGDVYVDTLSIVAADLRRKGAKYRKFQRGDMKFKQGTRRKAIDYEKDLVKYWKDNHTFEKSIEMRPKDNSYVFYDGPPFITGSPHHGNLLTSIVKDAVPRYQTMKGKRVERRWGWDCHGLPAEVYTEKKLGILDKREIGTKISLEDYINACRTNMQQTGDAWESTIDRIGRWVDFKGAYRTMDKDFMESVWWAFSELYKKGKIYEGEKVLMYCTHDATPISKAEVAMDNSYENDTDPSVYVKFKLVDWPSEASLLVWTTTPWTLNSNTAIAVNKDIKYAEVELDGERLILATDLLDQALTDEKHQVLDYTVMREFKGSELVGKSYVALLGDRREQIGDQAYRIWHADFVHAEDGTGIAHESPAYGEEDYALSKQEGFPFYIDTDDEGYYLDGEWKGKQIWEVNKEIAKVLHERGLVWKIKYIQHEYPHCHRCHTKLMYRAHPSWFMDIDGQRQEMLELNGGINWVPEHIQHGRFAKTVESAPDWNLSRDRFWATAMPVWKGKDDNGKEHIKVVGSYAELKELSGVELDDYHRPWVDDVKFTISGIEYTRIDKVLDCWFESGSMPFAQFHYPFENIQKFEDNFPGDFIVEYVAQVRAWFYYVHAVSVGLFGKKAFKTALVHGTLAGNDGRKMSKSFGNYTDPNELMDKYSADALRFLFLSSAILNGEDYSMQDKDVSDISRKLSMVWNMYDFFTLYASVDGWEFDGELADPSSECQNPLDVWIVSRMHELITEVEKHMDVYDLPNATKPILAFIEDASNWYVRRSRKRFWKSDDKADKDMAYRTLHYVLTQLSKVMAPFTPFLAEELYRNLTGGESVHLLDWPAAGHINELAITEMKVVRELINQGLSERAQNAIKVRQPLAKVSVYGVPGLSDELCEVIAEELNVKYVDVVPSSPAVDPNESFNSVVENRHSTWSLLDIKSVLDLNLTPGLKREGLMREVIRAVQNARKTADLQVDDRIYLSLVTESKDLKEAVQEHLEVIKAETLATNFTDEPRDFAHSQLVKVEGQELQLSLEKA
jgi:isoleucyl-tRNA synthetase